jgi:plastocyanin
MHAHRAPVLAIAVLVAAALGVTACGSSKSSSSASSSSSPGSGGKLSVTETEFAIAPKNPSVPGTGRLTITIANKGKFPHALAIEGPSGTFTSSTVQGGQTTTLAVNLTKKGTFTWYCPVDGHRQKGMVGKITVGGGGSANGGTSRNASSTSKPSNPY